MLLEAYRQRAIDAHNWTSFSPEKRGEIIIKDYSEELENDLREVEGLGGDPSDYRIRYERHFSAWIAAKSRCFSSMITGPARFPTRRAEKANASEHNHFKAFQQFREKYFARLRKQMRVAIKASRDPITDMRSQIEFAEQNQKTMKAANAIIRGRKTDAEKVGLLVELNISETAATKLLEPDWCGRKGFADYQLKNNSANIRRMRERLAELEKKATAETHESVRPDGIKVVANAEDDRLQIFFPGKPGAETIQNLKRRGWHWSPRNKCWQRQLTQAARASLEYILPD